jgi:uncharacterized RDD family membrane protein YckC
MIIIDRWIDRDMDFLPVLLYGERVYAGFWKRFWATIIDLIVMAPVLYLFWFVRLKGPDKNFAILITLVSSLVFGMYNVFFNARFGGSPGKLAMGIRITKPDGSRIGWLEAWKRSSVDLLYTSLIFFGNIWAFLQVDASKYSSIEFSGRASLLNLYYPWWYHTVGTLEQVWFWSELVVLLFNKRKRAIHDFIAGTVVIYKEFAEHSSPADHL